MNVNTDVFPCQELPAFLDKTQELLDYMQSLDYSQCKTIWKCNDKIAELNYRRFSKMDLEKSLTPAILSYEGIQYQYMAPAVMEEEAFAYLQEHLRILSGFYGILKPFDGVVPYRLEMQAKMGNHRQRPSLGSLYEFWGSALADALFEEDQFILNLASKEYSKCISRYLRQDIPDLIILRLCSECNLRSRKTSFCDPLHHADPKRIFKKYRQCYQYFVHVLFLLNENISKRMDDLRRKVTDSPRK